MERKIIKKECSIGRKLWYENEPDNIWYEAGMTDNGFVFKDCEAFESKSNDICYIAENDEYWENLEDGVEVCLNRFKEYNRSFGYTYNDILKLCKGDEVLAIEVFYDADWSFIETLINERNY